MKLVGICRVFKLEEVSEKYNVAQSSLTNAFPRTQKSILKKYGIKYDELIKNDIHIHFPEAAIPKEGPSAGITLTTALISAFAKIKIPKTVAMTGEITLRGSILPIGGLKEKSIGALRAGIKKIIIPEGNVRDLDEIPTEVKENIEYITVKHYKEVYEIFSKEAM